MSGCNGERCEDCYWYDSFAENNCSWSPGGDADTDTVNASRETSKDVSYPQPKGNGFSG